MNAYECVAMNVLIDVDQSSERKALAHSTVFCYERCLFNLLIGYLLPSVYEDVMQLKAHQHY